MERKSSVKDVHKLINQAVPELYKTLCEQLGEDNPFAKFSFGAGYYSWSDSRCQWKKMIDASDFEQSLVRESLLKLRESVSSKIGQKATDILFTIPDDSYIYFNDDNGNLKLLITGWGFKKPSRGGAGGHKTAIARFNPVSLSFSYDGVKQCDYEFGIQTAKQIKRLRTDSNGTFSFQNLKVGEHYVLMDIPSGRLLNLDIVEGQAHYDFDITRFISCIINATLDDQPLVDEPVNILCNSRKYEARTDKSGKALIELPLYEGMPVSAIMRDQEKCELVHGGDLSYEFRFESDKPEDTRTWIKVIVRREGQSVPSRLVSIHYGNQKLEGETDSDGIYEVEVVYSDNYPCTVTVQDYNSQSRTLQASFINEFCFDKKELTQVPPENVWPRVRVEHENGEIVANYPISIMLGGVSTNYTTNIDGIVSLGEQAVGTKFQITDGTNHAEEYIVESDTEEYIYVVPEKEIEEAPSIKIMFRDISGNPINCKNVRFQQQGINDVVVQLDEQGDTYFEQGVFGLNETVTASINGWDNNEYDPIPFVLEPDEYEYLLQEAPATTSTSWWKKILEILAVLTTMILLLYPLWPFFEGFCLGMFDAIYN